jgi:hypothetical protein
MSSIKQKLSLAAVVLKTGGTDPTPPTSLTNALEVTNDSNIDMGDSTTNSQADVVGRTMSNKKDLPGGNAGTATLNGNLHSTDQALDPAILPALQVCGQSYEENPLIVLTAAATNAEEGDTLTGDTSGATGTIKVIDGVNIIVSGVTGTFAAAEDVSVGVDAVGTISSVSDTSFYVYPDSTSEQVGSVFLWNNGLLRALRECAGTCTFSSTALELTKFSFTIQGKDDPDNWTDTALPTATYTANEPAAFVGGIVELVDGATTYAMNCQSAEFDLGNSTTLWKNASDDTGFDSAYIVDRSSAAFVLTVKASPYSEFDPQELYRTGTSMKVKYRIGDGTTSNTVYFRGNVQFSSPPSSSFTDNIMTWELSFRAFDESDSDGDYYMCFI